MAEMAVGESATGTATKKLVIKPLQIVLGALAGLGFLVLMQQYGMTTFTTTKLVIWMLVGGLVGFGLSNLSAMIARSRAQKAMREMPR